MTANNVKEIKLPHPIIWKRWRIKPGIRIEKGSILGSYLIEGDTAVYKMKSPATGIVLSLNVAPNETIVKDHVLSYINVADPCLHQTIMKDMCADCGADLRNSDFNKERYNESQNATISMVHSVPELKVSQNLAKILGRKDEERLLKTKKLVLLVDLDQTLIHTTNDPVPENLKGVHHFQLPSKQPPFQNQWFHARLRPNTERFLKSVSEKYELHICTFGVRLYAHKIAEILDPQKKYFSHRILSRDECFSQNAKTANLSALFPCGDSLVVIIDDREDVWSFNKNVIRVPPYKFFMGTADINAPSFLRSDENRDDTDPWLDDNIGDKCKVQKTITVIKVKKQKKIPHDDNESQSEEEVTKIEIEWEDRDDYLLHLEDILSRIHENFYKMYEVNESCKTKDIVQGVRAETLKGCKICFSGVYSRNIKPELSEAYQNSISLGAVIHNELVTEGDEMTTHLVAAKLGTKKVSDALKTNKIHVVNPSWLMQCADRWQHCIEELFPLNEQTSSENNRENMEVTRLAKKKAEIVNQQIEEEKRKKMEEEKKANDESKMEAMLTLYKLSEQELLSMDKEVDEIINETSSSSENNTDIENNTEDIKLKRKVLSSPSITSESSSEESLSGDYPHGWKRRSSEKMCKRKLKKLKTIYDYDLNISSSSSSSMNDDKSNDSNDDVETELVAAIERDLIENS